jgi:chromosome segregation ATPase
VRVRSELSRLRHSYEQLRAKRSSQQKAGGIGGSGHDYRQECHSLRSQLAGAKEKARETERECRELRERLNKREEEMERVEVERKRSQQSVSHLEETVRSKDGIIR